MSYAGLYDPDEELSACKRERERMSKTISLLTISLQRAISELGGSHTGHWDSTRQHGAGCPVCIEERKIKNELQEVIASLPN
jgi:hypothetical protein